MWLLIEVRGRELLLAWKQVSEKLLDCNQGGGWQPEENTRLIILLFLICTIYNSESSLSWQVSFRAQPRSSLFSLLLLKLFLPIITFRGMLAHKGRSELFRNHHVRYLSYRGTMTRIKRAQKGVVLSQKQKKKVNGKSYSAMMCVTHTNVINT